MGGNDSVITNASVFFNDLYHRLGVQIWWSGKMHNIFFLLKKITLKEINLIYLIKLLEKHCSKCVLAT